MIELDDGNVSEVNAVMHVIENESFVGYYIMMTCWWSCEEQYNTSNRLRPTSQRIVVSRLVTSQGADLYSTFSGQTRLDASVEDVDEDTNHKINVF